MTPRIGPKRVATLWEALAEAKVAPRLKLPDKEPGGFQLPFEPPAGYYENTTLVSGQPTLEEIEALRVQPRYVTLSTQDSDIVVTAGNDNDFLAAARMQNSFIICRPIRRQIFQPSRVFDLLTGGSEIAFGCLDSWYLITFKFIARVQNFTNDRPIDYNGQRLKLTVHRKSSPFPLEKVIDIETGRVIDPVLFYAECVAATEILPFAESFAVDGLQRLCSGGASATVYYLTWQDFKALFERHGSDFRRVFDPHLSWLDCFSLSA